MQHARSQRLTCFRPQLREPFTVPSDLSWYSGGMKPSTLALAAIGATAVLFTTLDASAPSSALTPAVLARGQALVVYGTCNDCHTPGWRDADGAIPVARWLTGSSVGFRGWWGTSYPTNIRLEFQAMPVERWIQAVRTRAGHPPMVWQDLRQLPDADLRAIYAFVKSLGPAGTPAPAAVEPWRQPSTPFIDMRALPTPRASSRVRRVLKSSNGNRYPMNDEHRQGTALRNALSDTAEK